MADSPAAERALDESQVRELLGSAPHDLHDLPLRLVAEGWDNAIWRLGDRHAVRLPRRERSAPLTLHEQQALPVIAPMLREVGVRVPSVVHAGTATASFPWAWSVIEWIDGQHALERPRPRNTGWAPQLAAALLALHQPAPDDAPPNPVRGVALGERDAAIRRYLARVPDPARAGLSAIWDAGLLASATTERTWIHGDLHPGNIVIDHDALAALIDFGDVTAGDPAYDIAGAWLAFDATGRGAFRSATGDRYDASTWVRARAWAAALAAILLGSSDDRDDFRTLGEQTAAALLAERN